MRCVLLSVALIAFVFFPVYAQDDECAWNPCVQSNIPEDPFPCNASLHDTPCLELSDASVIWLENDGCHCVVDIRIVAAFRICNGDSGDISQTCDTYDFGYQISGAAAGDGSSVISAGLSGSSLEPPAILFESTVPVDCGGVFAFSMSSHCVCVGEIETWHAIGSSSQTPLVSVVYAQVLIVTTGVICSTNDEFNAAFVAACDIECDPLNTPEAIPIE